MWIPNHYTFVIGVTLYLKSKPHIHMPDIIYRVYILVQSKSYILPFFLNLLIETLWNKNVLKFVVVPARDHYESVN